MDREVKRALRQDLVRGISAVSSEAAAAVKNATEPGSLAPSLNALSEILLEFGCVKRAEVATRA